MEQVSAATWQPRRLAAVEATLPDGVTPPGTRGGILHAALGLFAECGFHGASIRDIATRVGINSATLYAHYPSKEHVLAELVRLGHEELHARLTRALRLAGTDPAVRLAALAREHALVHTDYPLLAVVANGELHALSPAHAAPALAIRARSRQLLLDVLDDGVTAGRFAVADVPLTATAIGGMGMHIANWFGPDQPYTPEAVAAAHADFALRLAGVTATTLMETT